MSAKNNMKQISQILKSHIYFFWIDVYKLNKTMINFRHNYAILTFYILICKVIELRN